MLDSVIVGTAQIVPALGADQLAVMPGKKMAAIGADLLVMNRTVRTADPLVRFRTLGA